MNKFPSRRAFLCFCFINYVFWFIESIFIWFRLSTVLSSHSGGSLICLEIYGLMFRQLDYFPISFPLCRGMSGKVISFLKEKHFNDSYSVKSNNYSKTMLITREMMPKTELSLLLCYLCDCVRRGFSLGGARRGGAAPMFENTLKSLRVMLRWGDSKMKHKRFISAFSLMLIFMSCSCMSLIYLPVNISRNFFTSRFIFVPLTSFFLCSPSRMLRMLVC